MKNILKLMLLFFVLLFAGTKSFGSPDISGEKTMTDTQKQTIQTSQQFTADELWEKLLKVVELPNGYVAREQVENIFGVTLTLDEQYLKKFHAPLYNIKDQPVYLGVVKDSAGDIYFKFEWGQMPGVRRTVFPRSPSGVCIDAYQIMPSITRNGWKLIRETRNIRDILDSNVYRKGETGILRMDFFPKDNCLASIDIYTSKIADQLAR